MKTISDTIENEIIIKNSKFITILFPFTDHTKLKEYLMKAEEKYPKATHYTYAYITKHHQKASDDNEPSGTAGIPMLTILQKENLQNILGITIRYFGGIKLGAGGLIRAYSKSLSEAIKKAKVEEIEEGVMISFSIPYDMQKRTDYLLKDSKIINKSYAEDITYTVFAKEKLLESLASYNYQILQANEKNT